MTINEFSDTFDLLINAQLVPGITPLVFNEYEKSVFLTRAQEDLVLSYYNNKNPFLESFEKTEEIRRYLNALVKTSVLTEPLKDSDDLVSIDDMGRSTFFKLPENLWFVTYESVSLKDKKCGKVKTLPVVPALQDEWNRLKDNPFRGVNDRRALRFDLSGNIVEIVCAEPIAEYKVRYLKKLSPIILVDLEEEGLTIDGQSKVSNCELDDTLHESICRGAVSLALQTININQKK